MQAVRQRVAGEILAQGREHALVWRSLQPAADDPDLVFLRFPFVTRGPGDHIFPAYVLDDFGREIRSLKMYAWVRENGDRFPRGEIFGFEADGRDTQVFLREMELLARLPCYAYATPDAAVTEGVQLGAILLPDEAVDEPVRSGPPADWPLPIRAARVTWWRIPPGADTLDLERLAGQAAAGR